MIGIFSLFGRSADQQLLDQAIRDAGLHPRLVPDAVKIVMQRQVKDSGQTAEERQALRGHLCDLLAYCCLGPDDFAHVHDAAKTTAVELRVEHALMAGDSRDAQMMILFLHTGLMDQRITDRYGLALDE